MDNANLTAAEKIAKLEASLQRMAHYPDSPAKRAAVNVTNIALRTLRAKGGQ